MFRHKATTACPDEPYLEKKGLQGRRLGTTDAAIDFAQANGYCWLLNVNAVFIACRKQISPNNVLVALRNLCKRHPNLRMGITTGVSVKDRYLTSFATNPEPDLEVLDTDDWLGTVHKQLSNNFKGDGLQWRVKMLQAAQDPESGRWRHTFVFCFNHSIVDGGSIMAGVNTDFLHYLEDAVARRDSEIESHVLLPCREVLFPKIQQSILDRIIYKCKGLFHGNDFGTDELAGELVNCLKPEGGQTVPATKIITFDLTVGETGRIVQKCKDRGVKVNGYVSAAAAIATAKLVRENTKWHPNDGTLHFHTAYMVNLRRFANPPILPGQLGFINSIIPMDVTVTDDGSGTGSDAFWDLAKTCHNDVHSAIANNAHYSAANFVNYFFQSADFDSFFSEGANGENQMYTYYMTNRGNFQIESQFPEEEASCSLEANYWAAAEHMLNVSVFVHSLQSLNGRMMWTLTYYGHKCTDEKAKKYTEDIKAILLLMAQ